MLTFVPGIWTASGIKRRSFVTSAWSRFTVVGAQLSSIFNLMEQLASDCYRLIRPQQSNIPVSSNGYRRRVPPSGRRRGSGNRRRPQRCIGVRTLDIEIELVFAHGELEAQMSALDVEAAWKGGEPRKPFTVDLRKLKEQPWTVAVRRALINWGSLKTKQRRSRIALRAVRRLRVSCCGGCRPNWRNS
jgi:hypothetical protein